MSYDVFTALAAFAFVTSITPGPNNLMLLASGANFGIRRSIPHMLGIGAGFVVMVIVVGIGLSQLFDAYPLSHNVLQALSIAYLLYLAWKVAHAGAPASAGRSGSPMSFLQAALFQWVNPKGWAMAMTAVSIYAPSRSLEAIMLVALIFGAINLPSVSLWTVLGQQIQRILTSSHRLRIFNIGMALLLVASLYPVLIAG